MRILDNLFGPQADNLQRAMGRTTLRHSLLAENLANLNTPDYKRRDVDFGIALDQEMDRASITTESGNRRLDGNSVDLEQEIMGLAETQLRYETLAEMTSRYFSGLKNVIREGK